MTDPSRDDDLLFVTSVSRADVLARCLLRSPCLQPGGRPLVAHFNAPSAAAAANAALDSHPGVGWLVWVHQDVLLPAGWDRRFAAALAEAGRRFPQLAVAGVYGLAGHGAGARRAGHVLDRGTLLREPEPLPCAADSLDELLVAVRPASGLRFDPALGFDFYATDLVLQARQRGLQCAVVDAYCEHWSDTPRSGAPPGLAARIKASARAFEAKWAGQLPVSTPCFHIDRAGAVAAQIDAWQAGAAA